MGVPHASHEFEQGYFAEGLRSEPRSFDAPVTTIKMTRLSTGTSHELKPTLPFDDFLMDPSQDLLVLLDNKRQTSQESNVYLRSIKDGSPHADAYHPDWQVFHPFSINRNAARAFIEISGDLLAIRYISSRRTETEILIWDWKRATLLNWIQCDGSSHASTFLTSNSIVLFQSIGPVSPNVNMLVYDNIRTPRHSFVGEQPGEFHISQYKPLAPRILFEFPTILPMSLAFLWLKNAPTPAVTSSGSIPFLPLPETRVFELSLSIGQLLLLGNGMMDSYRIFICKTKLLEHVLSVNDQTQASQNPVKIPWEKWGEYSTRWFAVGRPAGTYVHRAYGTRFLQVGMGLLDEQEHLSVIDFHAPSVRRFSSLGCDAHLAMWPSKDVRRHVDLYLSNEDLAYRFKTLRSASLDKDERVFVDTIDEDVPSTISFHGATIQTRLPYRIVTWVREFDCRIGWLMDNSCILAMPLNSVEDVLNGRVQIYTPHACEQRPAGTIYGHGS